MDMKTFIVAFFCVISLLLPDVSPAGVMRVSKEKSDPRSAYNPHPDATDIELPMPNDLKMVLRIVSIPAKDALSDLPFDMGMQQVGENRGFYEKRVESYISSSITYDNLPAAWKKKIPADEQRGYYYYFIGKYEVTNAQWNAVMGITDSTERGDLPKANISWYDIQLFLQKYNEWLLTHHSDLVPVIETSPLFFRLPTEAEWEFAARGGNLPREMQTDFVVAEGKKVEDYAVFGLGYDKPMPIGSKNPNRLGMYDTSGNVAELVQDQFRFTVVEAVPGGGLRHRLHGSQGGGLSKGGSFLSHAVEQVYPGRRVEVGMFSKGERSWVPHHARTLGLRLVLASINVQGMRKTEELSKLDGFTAPAPVPTPDSEVKPVGTSGKNQPVDIDPAGDPLVQLDKIIASTASPIMKSNLEQFKDLLKDYNIALENERDANLLNSIRSSVYKADALGNFAFRFYEGKFKFTEQEKKAPIPPDRRQSYLAVINLHYNNLDIATNDYRMNGVNLISKYPKEKVDAKIIQLQKEYSGDGKFYENFRKNIKIFAAHVDFARKNGIDKLTNLIVWKDALPKNVLNMLQDHQRKSK